MATMIPGGIDEFKTEGERRFFRILESVAKPDHEFTTWYLPDIERREPDFILFGSEVGLLIFEVKDWALDQIVAANTPAEQKLWTVLRNRNLEGLKFRRQHPIGNFIVDFYCAEKRLVIEIDGDSHALQEEYDRERTEWLACQDLTVIRYNNRQILHQLDQVLQDILAHISNGI